MILETKKLHLTKYEVFNENKILFIYIKIQH